MLSNGILFTPEMSVYKDESINNAVSDKPISNKSSILDNWGDDLHELEAFE
ncbi:MAG: hypothetical protein HRT37_19985 [Alteromonadaceae bacterium]|nr:hypothetical protein [Alteromonadaceae bacterium]